MTPSESASLRIASDLDEMLRAVKKPQVVVRCPRCRTKSYASPGSLSLCMCREGGVEMKEVRS